MEDRRGDDADRTAPADEDPGNDDPAAAARAHLLSARRELLETVCACADAVAADWPTVDGRPATTERDRVVGPLAAALERSGALAALPDALSGAVGAAGRSLPAPPVPAPPYVAVTSRGPVLRATLPDGRLVATVAVLAVARGDGPVRYVRTADGPEAALAVSFVGGDRADDGP